MTASEATTPAATPGDDGSVAGRGSTADYCAYWGANGEAGEGEPHHMVSHSGGGELVKSVDKCSFCGWIDFAALDRWAELAIKNAGSQRAQRIGMAASLEPFTFVQQAGEELALEEILSQALGAASMCWIPRPSTAEFDGSQALRIFQALKHEVEMALQKAANRGEVPENAEG